MAKNGPKNGPNGSKISLQNGNFLGGLFSELFAPIALNGTCIGLHWNNSLFYIFGILELLKMGSAGRVGLASIPISFF